MSAAQGILWCNSMQCCELKELKKDVLEQKASWEWLQHVIQLAMILVIIDSRTRLQLSGTLQLMPSV